MHGAVADHLLAAGRGYAAAAPHVLATAVRGDAAAADVLRRAAHEVLETMATTSVTFIRQAFELTAADDPAGARSAPKRSPSSSAPRQFDAAGGLADALLPNRSRRASVPACDCCCSQAVVGRAARRAWRASWGRRTFRASVLAPERGVAPELSARLAGYRALAQGMAVAAVSAEDTTVRTTDQVAGVLATVAAAEQAERDGDYARTHELFAAACAAAQATTGVGLPEVGQLAARELLTLARLDDIDGALTRLDDGMRFPDSWQAPQLALLRARLACGAGRLADAAAAADTAAALMAELGDSTFRPELRRLTALIALLRGDMSRVRTELAVARQAGDELPLVRALLADAEGDPRAAAEVVALAGADQGRPGSPGRRTWCWWRPRARRSITVTPRRCARRPHCSPGPPGGIRMWRA